MHGGDRGADLCVIVKDWGKLGGSVSLGRPSRPQTQIQGACAVGPMKLGEKQSQKTRGLSLDAVLWLAVLLCSLCFPMCTMEVG